ncbi:MAG: response regulator [Thermodesulfobacteriota bacterium]
MDQYKHTVLCVDDEENILHSLKRLLRREDYLLLTATSGAEALRMLKSEEVHVAISDQRMPEMSGVEFLARMKEEYPDVIRIVLTGYTDVDCITESINKGHIYKLLLKPWNDQNLKLEIRQALEQYDLVQTNRRLNEQILEQNERLRLMNEGLESLVQERTRDLEIQNCALELSRAILEDLPLPILGVSSDGMVVLMNRKAQSSAGVGFRAEIGRSLSDSFPGQMGETLRGAIQAGGRRLLGHQVLGGEVYDIDVIPLSGKFRGKGVILTLRPNSRFGENAEMLAGQTARTEDISTLRGTDLIPA